MPRYHALDTAIKLCVWDPSAEEATSKKSDVISADQAVSTISTSNGVFCHKTKETHGPASGYVVDDLKEEYFEGDEGVNFLDSDMPFYLVKAGSQLFHRTEVEEMPQSSMDTKDKNLTEILLKAPSKKRHSWSDDVLERSHSDENSFPQYITPKDLIPVPVRIPGMSRMPVVGSGVVGLYSKVTPERAEPDERSGEQIQLHFSNGIC